MRGGLRRRISSWILVVCDNQGDIPGWTSKFIGRAKNGVYQGQVGDEGKPGWTTYDGTIERDGRNRDNSKGRCRRQQHCPQTCLVRDQFFMALCRPF